MPTESASQALEILRDPSQFTWYVIPLLALVVYVYANEIERRNWSVVLAGLALWGMDWINETWNSLVFHITNYAPCWAAPGDTAYLILIGLNIEIGFMFAIAGVCFAKVLPADRKTKILGLPNRWFLAATFSLFCVVVELLLNACNALTWDYPWWSARAPWLIFLIGYFHFFVVAFLVHDMKSVRGQAIAVGVIWAIAAAGILVFGVGLGWI